MASSREAIERRILVIRGRRVMIDRNLAEPYGVETGALVRAMKRNSERFPEDFAFQLSAEEWDNLRCQFGISSEAHGGRRFARLAEHDTQLAQVFSVLRQLVAPPPPAKKRAIGFTPPEGE
ncbi:MAG: ORF6N domain-containing protein [Gaiellaceae bacterium]